MLACVYGCCERTIITWSRRRTHGLAIIQLRFSQSKSFFKLRDLIPKRLLRVVWRSHGGDAAEEKRRMVQMRLGNLSPDSRLLIDKRYVKVLDAFSG